MQLQRSRKKSLAEINVVPYIDVMLVLLVIFMITAPLLSQGVNVKLPQAAAKSLPTQQKPVILSVDRQGHYFLNISPHPQDVLSAKEVETTVAAHLQIAKSKQQAAAVYVKADRDVDYGNVMNAMVLLQQAGTEQVGLITAPVTN